MLELNINFGKWKIMSQTSFFYFLSDMIVSRGCRRKLPHTQWFTTETWFLIALEAKGLRSRAQPGYVSLRAPGKNYSKPLCSFCGLQQSWVFCLWTITQPPALSPGVLPVSLLLEFFFHLRHPLHWIRAQTHLEWPHPNLITSVKTLFPNGVLFIGSRSYDFNIPF
jgi:hypothetical protein